MKHFNAKQTDFIMGIMEKFGCNCSTAIELYYDELNSLK